MSDALLKVISKERPTRQHLVKYYAKRQDIRLQTDISFPCLLRKHIVFYTVTNVAVFDIAKELCSFVWIIMETAPQY